ncbi:MAG: DUF4012 domain-containing protein [Anaerolineae bacterium]|nr:DUF4012 domain-containing protein [Anaerolineae bacterium]
MEDSQTEQPSLLPEPNTPVRRRHHHSSKSGNRLVRKLRRRMRHVKWGTVALVLVALVAVVVVGSLALAADSNNRVRASLSSLERIINGLSAKDRTQLTLTDFDRLETSVTDMVSSLNTARQQLGVFQPFTVVSGALNGTLRQLDASQDLALAAREMLNGLRPTLFFLVQGDVEEQVVTQISSGERMVELLQIGRSSFIRAGQNLDAARAILDDLNPADLTADLILNADQLSAYHQQLVQVNTILMNAPDLLTAALGLDTERSYLILSQNSDELRPSGGYISTFGWMTIRNGRVTGYSYSPTTATSPNPPPTSLASQVTVPDWWIRYSQPIYAAWDGSWYADFPSTAEMAVWYYNSGNNPQSPVDGVIAIDIIGFEKILAALGQVVVPGYNEIITPDNFRQVVYDIRARGGNQDLHKEFIAAVYQQIFEDWQTASSNPQISTRLLGELLQAVEQKHIMLYFTDDSLQQAIGSLGWSGAQVAAQGHDYLMVADANLGNKSNGSIFRQMVYDVEIEPGGTLHSRATIAYDYSDRVASQDPAVDPEYHGPLDYSNLLQVYVPPGSQIEATSNLPQEPRVIDQSDHSIFVSRVSVAYDTSERFQYTYQTPVAVETVGPYQRYRLLIQKQPGTPGDAVNVQVSLPVNAKPIGITPEPAASYNLDRPILEFRLVLTSDQWIEVIYQPAG